MDTTEKIAGRVVGNTSTAESSVGFKADIQNMIDKYAMENVDIARDFERVIAKDSTKNDFIDRITESVNTTAALSDEAMVSDSFYSNYSERLAQLIDNSCQQIAREAVITGYAPIVSYAPFFIKKQWVACVWKDVLMSEVATSPILNYKFEKRYLKTQDGTRYAIPDVYYSKADMAKLYAESTGVDIDSSKAIDISGGKGASIDLLKTTDGKAYDYLVGTPVITDKANVLTPDIAICKVKVKHAADNQGGDDKEYEVATNIRVDITSHNFIKGEIRYTVKDEKGNPKTHDGKVVVLEDTLVGNVNFDTGHISVFSTTGVVTTIYLSGKTANRFNHRSLDVERRVEQLQYIMPESGPRLNSAVTVEEAADAIALARIDMFADNVDMMGDALANLNDFSMRTFVDKSWNAQKESEANGQTLHGYQSLIEEGGFNAVPFAGYATNISTWMTDAKEYFERFLENLKQKLNTPEVTVVCVCNPALVRYIRAEIKWIFSDQTDVSGLKIQYNLGVTTIAGDRVHIISCRYLDPTDGIQTILIPTTTELITFKNIFYSVVVDRGYRNPLEQLVPNIMSTQRTLTFEVLPVQGRFYIDGRDATPPKNLTKLDATDRSFYVNSTTTTAGGATDPGHGG